ncbi:hypothetical protein XA68_12972 [Ophiocordyceps unilateralis]|uniref:Uncharacterized protein n=1 Tax=Ophiocordyceps unilateralis TaxID=268505 RepID=A0A2A9PBS6_OPHUN|nr:hypothetical protein XA68_12972 [Ophiocordyceps unilateralis]
MPRRDSSPRGGRVRHQHQHSASMDCGGGGGGGGGASSSRALVPMWDSSDPDRAPPPLPPNPQSPSLASRAGTSAAIQQAHAALGERERASANARDAAAVVPALARRVNDAATSPERALVKGHHHHRRMQSSAGSVRDLGLMLEGGPRSRPPPAWPLETPSTPTRAAEGDGFFAQSPGPNSSLTPIVRPSVRRPATSHSILGENAPPPSSTILALQTMGAATRPCSRDGGTPSALANITNNGAATAATSPVKPVQTLDGLSSQILGLTSIAQALQKELTQLSRRSRDNATDLLSLKEAANTRDENIRRSLRDLMGNVGDASSRIASREHYGGLFLDNKPHCTSPSNGRPFQLPRVPSPKSFAESIDRASISTPSLSGGVDNPAFLALLERILRGLGTKEGQESLVGHINELSDKVAAMATAEKLDELARLVREQTESAVVSFDHRLHDPHGSGTRAMDLQSKASPDSCALTSPRLLHGDESRRLSAPANRGAELLNEDLIKIIRSVKDSVAQGGGLTAEVKALVRELRGEVLGMGRELGKRLERMGTKAVEESEPPSKDDVSRVIDEGLEQMKEQLNHVLREHRRQSQASATSNKTLVDYQEIYNAMRAALRDNEASRGEMPDLSREDVLEAVRDAWESYKPEIQVQQLGLERDEVLTCLKEGLQEYMPRDEKPAGATREEVFKAVVEGLKHFVPPQMESAGTMSRDEIIEAVRDCLEEFEFPVSASAVGHDMTHSDMVHAVKEGLEGLDLAHADAVAARPGNDEVLARLDDVVEYLRDEFRAVSDEAKQNVAASGRDTEQVLDATKDGLENLRVAIEGYVDRAVGETGQEEFLANLSRSMDEFKDDLVATVSRANDGSSISATQEELLTSLCRSIEELKDDVAAAATRGATDSNTSTTEELLAGLCGTIEELKDEVAGVATRGATDSGTTRTEELLVGLCETIEELKDDVAAAATRGANDSSTSGNEELLAGLCGTMEELKNDLAAAVAQAGESSREQLQTELEGLRDMVNSTMVPAPPPLQAAGNNQELLEALHGGLNGIRQEILQPRPETSEILDAIHDGLNELRAGLDRANNKPVDLTANDEILDALKSGLDSVRSDIEALNESSNQRAVVTATADDDDAATPERAIVPMGDMVKPDDIKRLEVLITQLRIKIEAMEPQRDDGGVQQEDMARLEDMLRNVQECVVDMSSRQPPVAAETTRDAAPADGDAATKEDVEAIETILRNTKDRLDDLIDGEQAVRKEHLDVVEALTLETREALGALSEQLGGVCHKDDLAGLEPLLEQVNMGLSEMKEHAEKNTARDDEATKTDVEAVETVVLEIKTVIDALASTDFASLSNKEDIAGLEAAVKGATEKLEAQTEASTKAHDDRQAEIVGVADRVTDVKAFLEEFRDTVRGRLEEGSSGMEALRTMLQNVSETAVKNENAGMELKEMLEAMKTQLEESKEVVVGARLESNEKLQEANETMAAMMDEKMAELVAKHDEFRAAVEERSAAGEARDIETEAAVVGTKAVAEDLKLLIDTLGSTVTDSLEKMEEASKTVFSKVEELAARSEESQADGKTEHEQTRQQLQQAATAVEELQGELKEYQPKIWEAVRDLVLLVGEHFEHSKASTVELQDKIFESRPAEQAALPPAEKYDDSEVRDKLDALASQKYDDSEVRQQLATLMEDKYDDSAIRERLDRLAEQRYDDTGVQEKLDQIVEQTHGAELALTRLEALDQVQQSVAQTAGELSHFLAKQTQRIADEHEEREKRLEETTAALERKLADKEHLEASVAELRAEEERLRRSVAGLGREQERLSGQRTRLTGDVSSLETAMRLRKEELSEMEHRAERLERRIMEGVMDHSRVLLMAKNHSKSAGDKMSRKRVPKPERTMEGPAVSMALSARRALAPAAPNGGGRRIASLSQMNKAGKYSGSSLVVRSHSVRSPARGLRKRSWGGGTAKGLSETEDKENVGVGATVEEESEAEEEERTMLLADGSTTVLDSMNGHEELYEDDGETDGGTLRRSSMGTTATTETYSDSDSDSDSDSGDDETRSDWTESAVGPETGLVVYEGQ